MCECLTWHHPVWRAAAKLSRTQPDTVFAVFCALDDDGAAAIRLKPEILAAGLGRRTHVIERILASLASLGVTCDGVVTREWRRGPAEDAAASLSTKPSAIRMRRKRLRDGSIDEGDSQADIINGPASPGVTCDAPLLEEREQDSGLYSSKAQAPARDPLGSSGWGSQAEEAKRIRAERWLASTLLAAQGMMSLDRFTKLYSAAYTEPRPRWAQLELDRIDKLVRAARGPPPDQGWLKLPIEGRRAYGR